MANPTQKQNAPKATAGTVDGNKWIQEVTLPDGTVMKLDYSKFADWSTEQIGFAPYWEPKPGATFAAIPRMFDNRDENFLRYTFEAYDQPVVCKRGAKPKGEGAADTRETVVASPGEMFSIGVYYQLQETLNLYLDYMAETGEDVVVLIRAIKKAENPTKSGYFPWNFEAKVNPEQRPKLDAFRSKRLKELSAGEDNKQLEA